MGNDAVVREWFRRVNDDGEPPADLCHEEIVIENVEEAPITGPYHGHAGTTQWLKDIYDVVGNGRFDLEEVIDLGDGETVISVQRLRGRARHTGIEVDYEHAALWRVHAGRIASVHGYASKVRALEVAGRQ